MVHTPKILRYSGASRIMEGGPISSEMLAGTYQGLPESPQLIRFKRTTNPPLYIGTYLYYVYLEGTKRGTGLIRAR